LAWLPAFFFEAFLAVDFLVLFTIFLAPRLSAVRFDAALLIELTAFFTVGVFAAAALRTRFATDWTAVSASAPAAAATKSVTCSPTGGHDPSRSVQVGNPRLNGELRCLGK